MTVPASLTVLANNASALFTATVGAVTTTQWATLTGTLNSSSHSIDVSLVSPMLVSALSCNRTDVNSDASTTCTVTLNRAAPPAGSTVILSSDSALLTTSPSVSVAAGAASVSFTATAGNVTTSQSVTVTASLNASSQSASLTLMPAVLVSALTCNPGTISSDASSVCTVTLNEPAPPGGSLVALSDSSAKLSIPATVTVSAAETSATFTATAGTFTGNLDITLTASLHGASATASLILASAPAVSSLSCSPTFLTSGSSSTCTVQLDRTVANAQTVRLSANNPLLMIPASVSVAAQAVSGAFTTTAGTVTAGESVTITARLDASGLESTAAVTLNLSPVLPTLLSCDNATLNAGSTSTCTITLSGPAPAGGVPVALSSDGPALTVPPSLNIPASSSAASFTVAAAADAPSGQSTVAVTGTLYGASQSASFTVTICPCSLWNASAQPANPDSNDNQATEVGLQFLPKVSGYVTGVLFFKALDNTGTHVGNLWSGKGEPLATVTFTNETPSGWQLAYFPSPVAVIANIPYVISYHAPNGHYAADNGSFTNALRNPPLLAVADGKNGPNGVYQYGAGGFPTSGASATNFWVNPVFNTSPAIGTTTPVSLWTPAAVPATPAAPTSQAAQLGLTFISDIPGYATGLRFYKSSTNVGQHLGYLWNSAGTLLASVTFTNESATGWQQANFSTPVAIDANTVYVVSYWSPEGHYADDAGYFATSGITNQMLYAPPDGQYGPNGSYAASNAFPASSANSSNYWVDLVFTTAIQ